jgi:hypothetical protein
MKKQLELFKTNKTIGSLSTYNKAPAAVKKLVDSFEFTDNYNQRQKIVKNLEAKGYKIEFSMDGSIEKFVKIPAKKVGIYNLLNGINKTMKNKNIIGMDQLTKRFEYGEIYDTYLQLYLVKFANLSFQVYAVTGEGLKKALKHPEGKNQTPIVYRVKSYGIPKFEKLKIAEIKNFK